MAEKQGGQGIDQKKNRETSQVDALPLKSVVESEALLASHRHAKGNEKASQIGWSSAYLKSNLQGGKSGCMHGSGHNPHGAETSEPLVKARHGWVMLLIT